MEKYKYKPYCKFIGFYIPNWLGRRPEVSAGGKLCFGRLCQFAGKKNYCFPSRKTLANELGVSISQIKRYIAELKHHKLIEVIENTGKTNHIYFLKHSWTYSRKKYTH